MDIRQQREQAEARLLAPCAVRSAASRGRRHAEPPHAVRLAFERDRDRVIHSRCFRRLEYKAQVFVNGTADHYRTRLTHTMEMAAVSRTLARFFGVNEDLTEAIALAHDIGHTPFGHCGEFALDALMQPFGGFDHNRQSLRWVELLEAPYPGFAGLNLTWEVRAGLMKHEAGRPAAALDGTPVGPHLFIEAQVADVADDMAYYAHDVDDGLEARLLTESALAAQPLWRRAARQTALQYSALSPEQHRRITVRNLLDVIAQDVMQVGRRRLDELRPASPAEVMNAPGRVVAFSDEVAPMVAALREYLYREFYWSPAVQISNQQGVAMIRALFGHYTAHPDAMGRKAQARVAAEGLARTVCDYLSGFTDRYALEEFTRFGLEME